MQIVVSASISHWEMYSALSVFAMAPENFVVFSATCMFASDWQ